MGLASLARWPFLKTEETLAHRFSLVLLLLACAIHTTEVLNRTVVFAASVSMSFLKLRHICKLLCSSCLQYAIIFTLQCHYLHRGGYVSTPVRWLVCLFVKPKLLDGFQLNLVRKNLLNFGCRSRNSNWKGAAGCHSSSYHFTAKLKALDSVNVRPWCTFRVTLYKPLCAFCTLPAN